MSDEIARDLHRRLCDGDHAAPYDFSELFLPLLMRDRSWVPTGIRDEHLIADAAIDAIQTFVAHPERYNPDRALLLPYLRMSARGDLLNLLRSERRHAQRRAPLEAVDLQQSAGNDAEETPSLPDGVSVELLLRRLRELLPDQRDQQAIRLMLDGVKATDRYAPIYGLTHLPPKEQQRQIKQHKDRLDKVMKRLGKRIRDGQ